MEKINVELMRRYGEPITVVGINAKKLIKSAATRLPGMSMCINRAIQKHYLKEVFKLYVFSEYLHWHYEECSECSFVRGFGIGGGECVASLEPFSRVAVGIYNHLCLYLRAMIVKLEKRTLSMRNRMRALKRRSVEDDVLSELSNKAMLKAHVRHSSLDNYSPRENSARCIFVAALISETSIEVFVGRHMDLKENKEKAAQAQEKLL